MWANSSKSMLSAITIVIILLFLFNLRVLHMSHVYDLKEQLGDSVMDSFKIRPANRLVHVSRQGLGHRLIRDASAYHLAKKLNLARMKLQWGSCAKDTNWKGAEDDSDGLNIFQHLFSNDLLYVPTPSGPSREGKKVIVRNDVYGYVPGQIYKKFMLPLDKEVYMDDYGPFLTKMESDSEFYDKLVENYVFKNEVEEFMEKHKFSEHEVIGIHLRAGNGEERRTIEDEEKFIDNFMDLVRIYVRVMKILYHDRFAKRSPLIFFATDTQRLIPEMERVAQDFGVKVVTLPQIRVDKGATFKQLSGREHQCLEGWKDMTNDMMLLSHSDVIISARQSAFTQGLPLSRVFDKHEGEEGPHFCEVDVAGAHMTCLEDKKTWLFRDDVSKIIPISKGKGLNGLFDADAKQVHHKLLVQFPDVEEPKEFLDARTFLHSGRNLRQPDILKHMMGEKAIFPKYDQRNDGISQATKFNWASSDKVV